MAKKKGTSKAAKVKPKCKTCEKCGKVLKGGDVFDPLAAVGPKRWCGECVWEGLYWGLERWTEASE